MPRVSLDHTSISSLFEKTLEDPYDEDGYLRREYYGQLGDSIRRRSTEARLSAPIHGQPSLVGYLFQQIGLERTTLEPETLAYVKSPEGNRIIEHVVTEGGRHEQVASTRHHYGSNELMLIGHYLIEWDNGEQRFGQDYGPDAGPLIVHDFSTPEAAEQKLEDLLEADRALKAAHDALAVQTS